MKERKIKFNRNDETILEMTKEEKENHKKNFNELFCLLTYSNNLIENDEITVGFKEVQLSLLETYTTKILKDFNYDSMLEKEKIERHSKIKSLNIENRELRKQLGEKATAEDVRESLKNIENKFRYFWKQKGFGYCKDFIFGSYGLKVTISTSMLSQMVDGTKEEIEQRKNELGNYGFFLVNDGESDYNALGFSQKNIDTLNYFLSSYFSDFSFYEIDCQSRRTQVYIREIVLFIRNFDDLLNLDF